MDAMEMSQVLVAVVIPLASGVIAGLVAWVVAGRQRRSAIEIWVLDQRLTLWGELIDAMHDLLGSPDGRQRSASLRDPLKIARVTNLIHRSDLIAPERFSPPTRKLYDLLWKPVQCLDDENEIVRAINHVLDVLVGDLVPKHMR